MVGLRSDPYGAFRFQVEIKGLIAGGFTEVSGLQAETEVEEYHEGGRNEALHRLVKLTRYPNLVLKRGLGDSTLFDWYRKIVNGVIERQNGSILLLYTTGQKTEWRWEFTKAYPVKWVGPDFKADSNTIAFETLELVHGGF